MAYGAGAKWSVILLVLLAGFVTGAAGDTYKEGVHYQLVEPPVPTSTGERVEVVELFWYGCPHCYDFDPYVKRWMMRKPGNVEFVHIPAVFNKMWELHAQAFYTAKALGIGGKIHDAMFDAMHQGGQKLPTPASLQGLFAQYGVSEDDFYKAFNSFAVKSQVKRAVQLTKSYGIEGVPVMIVNGKYRVGARGVRSYSELLKVVDYLVSKEVAASTRP